MLQLQGIKKTLNNCKQPNVSKCKELEFKINQPEISSIKRLKENKV